MNTTIKLNNKGKCLMVAHRGASGLEKENTNAAFAAAGTRSYYGIETDVYKTADGHFVLIHDKTTARVSDIDVNIEESTYETIKNIILNDRDGKKGRSDLRIPDLNDYISICKKYNKVAVLELKSDFTSDEIEQICTCFKNSEYFDNLIVISFNYNNLVRCRDLYPDLPIQYLTYVADRFYTVNIPRVKAINADFDLEYRGVTAEIVEFCHLNGIKVNVWTVDDPVEAQRLIDMGVDFITTNILE